MSLTPIQQLWYFIIGAYNVCISNWVLSIPIAMAVLFYTFEILKRIRKLLKKGG